MIAINRFAQEDTPLSSLIDNVLIHLEENQSAWERWEIDEVKKTSGHLLTALRRLICECRTRPDGESQTARSLAAAFSVRRIWTYELRLQLHKELQAITLDLPTPHDIDG